MSEKNWTTVKHWDLYRDADAGWLTPRVCLGGKCTLCGRDKARAVTWQEHIRCEQNEVTICVDCMTEAIQAVNDAPRLIAEWEAEQRAAELADGGEE